LAFFDSYRGLGLRYRRLVPTRPQAAAPKRAGWQRYDAVSERVGDNGWLGGTRCDDASIFVGVDY
jgi:hypothetical protein